MTSNGGEPDADGARAARKRYDRLFERCLGAAESQYGPTGGRLDGRVVVELWRRSRLDDVQLRQIWCVGPHFGSSAPFAKQREELRTSQRRTDALIYGEPPPLCRNDVSTPDSRRTGGLDREEFARGMTAIDAELRRRLHK